MRATGDFKVFFSRFKVLHVAWSEPQTKREVLIQLSSHSVKFLFSEVLTQLSTHSVKYSLSEVQIQ